MKFDISRVRGEYLRFTLAGNQRAADDTISRALAAGVSPLRFYQDVLLWVYADLLQQEQSGLVTSSTALITTEILISDAGRLRTGLKQRARLGLNASVAGADCSDSPLASRSIADFLSADGWDVAHLGCRLTLVDVRNLVESRGSQLFVICLAHPQYLPGAEILAAEVRKIIAPPKILMSVIRAHEPVSSDFDGFAQGVQDTISRARELCAVTDAEATLPLFLKRFGSSVQETRKSLGLSQQQLADAAQLDRAYISSVENGKQNISVGAIAKLARALGVGLDELLNSEGVSAHGNGA